MCNRINLDILQEFTGNSDRNTPVTQIFFKPVAALYVRIVPVTWYYDPDDSETTTNNAPALRFELLGCAGKTTVDI